MENQEKSGTSWLKMAAIIIFGIFIVSLCYNLMNPTPLKIKDGEIQENNGIKGLADTIRSKMGYKTKVEDHDMSLTTWEKITTYFSQLVASWKPVAAIVAILALFIITERIYKNYFRGYLIQLTKN